MHSRNSKLSTLESEGAQPQSGMAGWKKHKRHTLIAMVAIFAVGLIAAVAVLGIQATNGDLWGGEAKDADAKLSSLELVSKYAVCPGDREFLLKTIAAQVRCTRVQVISGVLLE